MPGAINVDDVSLTTHHLHLGFKPTDKTLSSATGFIYEKGEVNYLITNWHNVSGRNPITEKCISKHLAVPDTIATAFRTKENTAVVRWEHLALYRDDEMQEPVWYEHPVHGHKVDVVAIPLPAHLTDTLKLFPINAIRWHANFRTEVADDAFIVGYPFSDMPDLQLPIWKRASIASEPDVDIGKLPKLLVDTATRPGLSGSPVVMQRTGIHGKTGERLTGTEIIGRIRNFIGVYSGRIGKDERKAQLGIVWKTSVIDEIIDARATSSNQSERAKTLHP